MVTRTIHILYRARNSDKINCINMCIVNHDNRAIHASLMDIHISDVYVCENVDKHENHTITASNDNQVATEQSCTCELLSIALTICMYHCER